MDWKYNGKEVKSIKDMPEGVHGIIYQLEFSNGKRYIGRKNIYSVRKRNFGKKELEKIKDKRKKTYEMVKKESNWKTYASSNKAIKELLESGDIELKSKEILHYTFNEKHTTYLETQALFCYGAIESEEFLNDNILGKFYRRDLNIHEKS